MRQKQQQTQKLRTAEAEAAETETAEQLAAPAALLLLYTAAVIRS